MGGNAIELYYNGVKAIHMYEGNDGITIADMHSSGTSSGGGGAGGYYGSTGIDSGGSIIDGGAGGSMYIAPSWVSAVTVDPSGSSVYIPSGRGGIAQFKNPEPHISTIPIQVRIHAYKYRSGIGEAVITFSRV